MSDVHESPVRSAFRGPGNRGAETPFIVKLRDARARKGNLEIRNGVETA
jgi:hypothetical protein